MKHEAMGSLRFEVGQKSCGHDGTYDGNSVLVDFVRNCNKDGRRIDRNSENDVFSCSTVVRTSLRLHE